MGDPNVTAYFRAIDLKIYKVRRLFQLMDVDKSGSIDRSEFEKGCDRLRGDATQLDQGILQYQLKMLARDVKTMKELMMPMKPFQRARPRDPTRQSTADVSQDKAALCKPIVCKPI